MKSVYNLSYKGVEHTLYSPYDTANNEIKIKGN